MELTGKTAIITGGASGMGRAVAQRLHRQGVAVAILDRNAVLGAALADELGGRTLFYQADVTSEADVAAALEATAARFGDVHICCNFAGIVLPKRTIGESGPMPLSAFTRNVDINLTGSFNVARLCADRMRHNAPLDTDDNRGVIINVSSVAAYQGPAGTVGYSASKAAITGMTLPLARDLAPFGIRVNTIVPGLILTPMTMGSDPAKHADAERRAAQSLAHVLYPKRFGTAEEVAHLTQFIIENDYINAECIRIDAGKRV
ncbi:MAG: SDR family NAD(P)-dependent oxidoreductase [Sphingomonas sp.]|uniref:SDR family NAD(P)-dependent oxidoreductase n=1 Tax=Sphingomonas sp. TaxID=28214 RepID=UPI0035A8E40A|nr:SDR family NAD(P)-dependent oxidoreductase [Sphingomonas sp.]